jgi:AcrR family transcriptional regulator
MKAILQSVPHAAEDRHKPARGRLPNKAFPRRILSVAAELFAEKEFHRVRTEQIAVRAGVSKGIVYRHFHSKEELYVAATIHGPGRLYADLSNAVAEVSSPNDHIKAIIDGFLAYFWSKRDFFLLLRSSAGMPKKRRRQYEAQRRKLVLLVREVLRRGVDKGFLRANLNIAVAAEVLCGELVVLNRLRNESISLSDAAAVACAIFLYGYAAKTESYAARDRFALDDGLVCAA